MNKARFPYAGLSSEIYILFVARIVTRMGDFVRMFLTLFLTTRIGLSPERTGFFIMITGLLTILGMLVGGRFSDSLGRKAVLSAGPVLAALAIIPCGFLGESMAVPWLLAASGFFNGAVRPAGNSMVADRADSERRKDAYSLIYLGTNLGVSIGPLIAGFLFEKHNRWIFWGDGLTSILSALLILIYIPESKPGEKEIKASLVEGPVQEQAHLGNTFKALGNRPLLLIFTLLTLVSNIVYSQHSYMIPQHLELLFPGDSARLFGFIMSFNALTVLIMTSLLMVIIRKKSPIMNMVYMAFFYCTGFGMLRFLDSLPAFFLSAFLWTMGEILMATNYGAYLADHSPINHRGRFNSILNAITGAGYALGPLLSGMLISKTGLINSWIAVSLAAFFLVWGFWGLKIKEEKAGALS